MTNFSEAIFTGAYLKNWKINSETVFAGITCEYIYLQNNQQDRLPKEGAFKPGEFLALFQQTTNTITLTFKNSINWQAFYLAFLDLNNGQHTEQLFSIQAIEKKQEESLIVRIEISPALVKEKTKDKLETLYKGYLAQLGEPCHALSQDNISDEYRSDMQNSQLCSNSLLTIVKTMADQESAYKALRT